MLDDGRDPIILGRCEPRAWKIPANHLNQDVLERLVDSQSLARAMLRTITTLQRQAHSQRRYRTTFAARRRQISRVNAPQ